MTGNEFFRSITEEILNYVAREMVDASGGFHSRQDADSEGEEGEFFLGAPGRALGTTCRYLHHHAWQPSP